MKLRSFIVFMIIAFIVLPPKVSLAMGSKNRSSGKGLYLYSGKEISQFLEKIGYPNFPIKTSWDVLRNADGTALRFFNWSDNKAVVVSCYGVIKEIVLPGEATWSARTIWFNKAHEVIAWVAEGKVHYKNGMSTCPESKAHCSDDLSGEYFMKLPSFSPSLPRRVLFTTEIYSIDKPDAPLYKIRLHGRRIFSKNDKVLVFGHSCDDGDSTKDTIRVHTLERRPSKLIPIEEVIIRRPERSPAPFNVEDLSPWNNEVLLVDVHDFPYRSVWYVFNLKTHEMRRIGKEPFGGGWGFYLQCDIIKEVTEKLRSNGVRSTIDP